MKRVNKQMATKQTKPQSKIATSKSTASNDVPVPEGYSQQTEDIVGFWDHEDGAIRFKPLKARIFDNSVESVKYSILIIGELTHPSKQTKRSDEDRDEQIEVDGNIGDMVGVWYKPGLKVVLNRLGVDCYARKTGEKDIGKPNPMIVFEVMCPTGCSQEMIPLESDTRDDSANLNTPWDEKKGKGKSDADEDFSDAPIS